MPLYHTLSDEEHPVFHVVEGCSAGLRIDDPHRLDRMGKRDLCKDCVALLKKGSPPMPARPPKKGRK